MRRRPNCPTMPLMQHRAQVALAHGRNTSVPHISTNEERRSICHQRHWTTRHTRERQARGGADRDPGIR